METSLIAVLEAWFAEHDGDGEFTRAMHTVPYAVIGPSSDTATILLTTKPRIVSVAIGTHENTSELGMIGRYGLPNRNDVNWICDVVGPRGILFVGDMDPVDLMVFLWLQESLAPRRIAYFGINDAFLNELDIHPGESLTLPLAGSEQQALELVAASVPQVYDLIGPDCTRWLRAGRKIELESIISVSHRFPRLPVQKPRPAEKGPETEESNDANE